jgi:phenylacetate-CoA ligase
MPIEDKIYKGLEFYNRAPRIIRNGMGFLYKSIPLSWRYGKIYNYYHSLLKQSPYWDDHRKEEYVIACLKKTLINAFENTIFYNRRFTEAKFDPYRFSYTEELQRLPYTEKSIFRQYKNEIINHKIPANDLLYVTTGGTSGIPVEVYYVKGKERSREFVFMTDQWKRAGYRMNDRIARLRGTVIDPRGNNIFFKYEPVKNRLYLSSYDLYEENLPVYIEKLKKFQPHFIHTYPSAVIILAKYITENKIQFDGLKAVLCSSEQFYSGQRELIEKAFNTRVYSWYGHTEGTTMAGECEINTDFHLYFEFGYTELIDEDGNIIKEPGVQGEIVGTSFEMTGFPVVRYRTGDFAEYSEGKCKCGRNYTLIRNVRGRWQQEQIITKNNSKISLTALNMHSNIFDHVIQYQFYQKEKGKVTLRIIKDEKYTDKDEKHILKSFGEKFKNHVDLNLEYVRSIPRTSRGKHKFLIQEIKESL